MTARYLDGWDNRPVHPDYVHREQVHRYTPAAECEHPIEARVSAKWKVLPNGMGVRPVVGGVARCHDCLLWLRRDGTWGHSW